MATTVTKFPAAAFGKAFYVKIKDDIQTLIDVGHITTASTITELQTALDGEIANDDPRS
jgi:hypothetical protein